MINNSENYIATPAVMFNERCHNLGRANKYLIRHDVPIHVVYVCLYLYYVYVPK